MAKAEKIKKYITHPKQAMSFLINYTGVLNWMSDRPYLKLMYWLKLGKKLNIDHPDTFCEKLQWLKLYNRCPEYTTMVDKVKVKEYVANIVGPEYVIPAIGVWNSPDDIDFDSLPDKFVLKCNHASHLGTYICRDKSKMDIEKVKAALRRGLRDNYYLHSREWPYKNVPRKILAEKLIEDNNRQNSNDILDYKFFCFDGEPRFLYVSDDSHHSVFLNTDWTYADMSRDDYKPLKEVPTKPDNLNEMLDVARKLSKGIPHVRVDLYNVNGQIYFGEMTFFTNGGFIPFNPESCDKEIGDMLQLSGYCIGGGN